LSLTADDVRDILALLDQSQFDELVLETDKLKIKLRRRGAAEEAQPAPAPAAAPAAALKAPAPVASAPPAAPAAAAGAEGLTDVPAPLLGVFYRAPKPGEPPFVEVGQTVGPETVIGIIEVMKLMNSVRAGVAGTVAEIPAENGKMVEFGQALIRVRTA
jgi:acetyl-CoA carboxylase biotin carboxyl carrier protein